MALDNSDLNFIKDVVFRNGHDIAGSIARTTAHIERYGDALESRIFKRLEEIEDKISLATELADVQSELRHPSQD